MAKGEVDPASSIPTPSKNKGMGIPDTLEAPVMSKIAPDAPRPPIPAMTAETEALVNPDPLSPKSVSNGDDKSDPKNELTDTTHTRARAVTKIQGVVRTRQARRELYDKLQGRYEKMFDQESGHIYYMNLATGETSWDKPNAVHSKMT